MSGRAWHPAKVTGGAVVLALAGFALVPDLARGPGTAGGSLAAGGRSGAVTAYRRLPLAFEVNRGQAPRGAAFIARGGGAVYELAREGATVWMRGARLDVRFPGSSGGRGLRGDGALGGHANYFLARRSITGIPLYAAVTLRRVSPGVDVRFHGREDGALEFDFLIAPRANAGTIGFTLSGQRRLAANSEGGLTAVLAGGQVAERRPFAYQWRGGRRVAVASWYAAEGGGRVRIALGRYDHARPLIVDPKLVYSTYLPGAAAIAVDRRGDAYITGPGFPTPRGSDSGCSVSVAKLDPTGTRLIYLTVVDGLCGSPIGFGGGAIGLDRHGDVYVAGDGVAGQLRTTPGAFQRKLRRGGLPQGTALTGPAIVKLSPDGSRLRYATYLAGSPGSLVVDGQKEWTTDSTSALAVDGAGHAFLVGSTRSHDFPVRNAYQPTYRPQLDAGFPISNFLSELSLDGRRLLYSTYLGGVPGSHVAVSSDGTLFVAGETADGASPTRRASSIRCPGRTFGRPSCGEADFVSAFRPQRREAASLLYTTLLGSSGGEDLSGVAADGRGDAFITGKAYADDFPTTPGAYLRAYAPLSFVTELAPRGRRLAYSTFVASGDASAIAVDARGEAFIAGTAKDVRRRRDALHGSTVIAADRRPDAYLKLIYVLGVGPQGRTLQDVTYIGEDGDAGAPQRVLGIAPGPHGDFFVVADPGSTQFPVTAHAYQRHSRGHLPTRTLRTP